MTPTYPYVGVTKLGPFEWEARTAFGSERAFASRGDSEEQALERLRKAIEMSLPADPPSDRFVLVDWGF